MAFKIPVRKYFTFPELIRRWECDENDIRLMILGRELIPSYVINELATVVKFEFSCPDLPEYESGYWSPESVKYDVLHGELEEVGSAKLVDADGFYYLLHPWQTASLNCTFLYFSGNRGHQQDSDETCFMLRNKVPSLDDVMKNGVAMADEVFRLERGGTYPSEVSNIVESEIGTKERNSMLSIIIGMAVRGYKYDPEASKNSAVTEIIDDMNELGIGISPDTLRKYLKEAKQILPTNGLKPNSG